MAGTFGSSAQTSHLAAAGNRAEERGGPGAALARGGTGGARGMRAAVHRRPADQALSSAAAPAGAFTQQLKRFAAA